MGGSYDMWWISLLYGSSRSRCNWPSVWPTGELLLAFGGYSPSWSFRLPKAEGGGRHAQKRENSSCLAIERSTSDRQVRTYVNADASCFQTYETPRYCSQGDLELNTLTPQLTQRFLAALFKLQYKCFGKSISRSKSGCKLGRESQFRPRIEKRKTIQTCKGPQGSNLPTWHIIGW